MGVPPPRGGNLRSLASEVLRLNMSVLKFLMSSESLIIQAQFFYFRRLRTTAIDSISIEKIRSVKLSNRLKL